MIATIATELEKADARALKAGDPTLGSPAPAGNIEPSDKKPTAQLCVPPTVGGPGKVPVRRSVTAP